MTWTRNVILDDLSRYGDVQVTDLEDGKVRLNQWESGGGRFGGLPTTIVSLT